MEGRDLVKLEDGGPIEPLLLGCVVSKVKNLVKGVCLVTE